MNKFEIVFKSGKSIFIDASKRSEVTVVAINLGKMDKLDCYDIQEILEVDPKINQKIREEAINLIENRVDRKPNVGYPSYA